MLYGRKKALLPPMICHGPLGTGLNPIVSDTGRGSSKAGFPLFRQEQACMPHEVNAAKT